MTSVPQEGPWQVELSGAIAAELRRLQRQAKHEGRGEQAVHAMELIDQRLTNDPQVFGEPLYRLPILKMQIRQAVVSPIAIDFGVCEDRPVVFIKGVKLLSLPGS